MDEKRLEDEVREVMDKCGIGKEEYKILSEWFRNKYQRPKDIYNSREKLVYAHDVFFKELVDCICGDNYTEKEKREFIENATTSYERYLKTEERK